MDKEEVKRGVSTWTFLPLKAYESPAQPGPEITDWRPGIHAFDHRLRDFGPEARCAEFPQAVVGLFGHARELLQAWAQKRDVQMLEPPPVAALLNGTATLWPELQKPGPTLLVLPELERCFLRHYRGIRLARQLVERTWSRRCRLIIGCEAWAWKYLCASVQIDALCSDALTAAPLMEYPLSSNAAPDFASCIKDSSIQAYVLHTLLVHNGASVSVLPHLLPFRTTEVLKALTDLHEQKLAFEKDGAWCVVPDHYAGIRGHLAEMDFWISDA